MIESAYKLSLFLLLPKLIPLLHVSFNYIFKIMKLPYSIPEVDTNYWFAIYYSNYKEKLEITESAYNPCVLYSNKLVSNPTWTAICTINYLCFENCLGHLGNFLTTSLFARV